MVSAGEIMVSAPELFVMVLAAQLYY